MLDKSKIHVATCSASRVTGFNLFPRSFNAAVGPAASLSTAVHATFGSEFAWSFQQAAESMAPFGAASFFHTEPMSRMNTEALSGPAPAKCGRSFSVAGLGAPKSQWPLLIGIAR